MLALGFQGIVIYQDRDPDPAYVFPLTPLAFSEENTGEMALLWRQYFRGGIYGRLGDERSCGA